MTNTNLRYSYEGSAKNRVLKIVVLTIIVGSTWLNSDRLHILSDAGNPVIKRHGLCSRDDLNVELICQYMRPLGLRPPTQYATVEEAICLRSGQ